MFILRPIVEQTSTISYETITQPIIYACQDNQFNYSSAKDIGYATKTSFSYGKTSNGKFTWTGKNGNLTYKNLVNLLFGADYESFAFIPSENWDDNNNRIDTDKVFLNPYGFCMKLLYTNKTVLIRSKLQTKVLLIDPARWNNLSLNYMTVYLGEFGPSDANLFHGYNYEVQIQLNDHTILDGETCTDYDKLGSSYGECLQNEMQDSFLNWYGCTPPWIQKKNHTCDLDKAVKDPSEKVLNDEIDIEMRRFIKGLKTESSKKCLLPCQSMKMELKTLYHLANRMNNGYVLFDINPNVVIHTGINYSTNKTLKLKQSQ